MTERSEGGTQSNDGKEKERERGENNDIIKKKNMKLRKSH